MTARSKKSSQPKDNAKGRRKKENTQLLDLAAQLPLPSSVASQLDKASVIRLATAYLKLRELFPRGLGREWGEGCSSDGTLTEMGKFLNKALHGFVFVLGSDATILYISEEASAQLGYSQVQLTGKNFWGYVHSTDAIELESIMCFGKDISSSNIGNCTAEDVEIPCSFAVRMKCILPKRQAELAIDRYKVIHFRGYLKLKRKTTVWDGPPDIYYEATGFVAAGHSLSPTPSAELKMYRRDFMFRTSLSLKFMYIEPGSQKIIGYEPLQLQDKSLYKFIHPVDCINIEGVHTITVKKTQAISTYYRFLTRNGGWIWMQSSCIVIANSKADRDQCILFINSVLSEREYPNRMLDMEQIPTPENNLQKKSHSGYKNKRKTPYQLQKELSTINPTLSNSSQWQSSPYQICGIQASDKTSKSQSSKSHSHSPESARSDLEPKLLESQQSVDEYQSHNLLQKDDIYISNHDRSVAPPWVFSGVDALGELEAGTNLPFLHPSWPVCGSSLTENESVYEYAKFYISAGERHGRSDYEVCNQNQLLESSRVSSVHTNSNLTHEHSTCHTLPNRTSISNIELNAFLHSNTPNYANENQSDGFSQNSSESSLPFGSWYSISQKPFHDMPSFSGCNFNLNPSLPISGNESFLDIIAESNKFPANLSISDSSKEGEINSTGFNTNLPNSLPCVDSKDGNLLASPNQEYANAAYDSEFTNSGKKLSCYDTNYSFKEECNELIDYSKMTATFEDIQTKLDWCDISATVPFVGSMTRSALANSACDNKTEYKFSNTSENQAFNKSSVNEKTQLSEHDVIHQQNNVALLDSSNEVGDLLVSVNEDEKDFHASHNQVLELSHIQSTSETSTVSYLTENNDFKNSHYSNRSPTFQTDEISASTVSNHDIIVYNHTKEICAPYNSNQTAVSNIIRTSSKAALSGPNDYLTLLGDQLKAMHSQPTPNARSDSASSISLGYASESSYFDQSSPFSTYGESPFS